MRFLKRFILGQKSSEGLQAKKINSRALQIALFLSLLVLSYQNCAPPAITRAKTYYSPYNTTASSTGSGSTTGGSTGYSASSTSTATSGGFYSSSTGSGTTTTTTTTTTRPSTSTTSQSGFRVTSTSPAGPVDIRLRQQSYGSQETGAPSSSYGPSVTITAEYINTLYSDVTFRWKFKKEGTSSFQDIDLYLMTNMNSPNPKYYNAFGNKLDIYALDYEVTGTYMLEILVPNTNLKITSAEVTVRVLQSASTCPADNYYSSTHDPLNSGVIPYRGNIFKYPHNSASPTKKWIVKGSYFHYQSYNGATINEFNNLYGTPAQISYIAMAAGSSQEIRATGCGFLPNIVNSSCDDDEMVWTGNINFQCVGNKWLFVSHNCQCVRQTTSGGSGDDGGGGD